MRTPLKLKQVSLAISIALGVSACSVLTPVVPMQSQQQPAPIMESQILSFNNETLPDSIEAGEGSLLSLSTDRYIMAEQSLKWDWSKNSTFTVKEPIRLVTDSEAQKAYGRRATQVLSFWIYNETAVDDFMIVDLGRGLGGSTAADAGYKVNMNFTGWRTIGVSLINDIEGREVEGAGITDNASGEGLGMGSISGGPRGDMDSIRFTAPSAAEKGTFYIDRIMLSIDDARYQWSDDQVKTRYDIPEIDFKLPKQLPQATPQEIAAAESIRSSLVDVFTSAQKLKGVKSFKSLDKVRNEFLSMRINRDEKGNLTGRHLITGKQKRIYQPDFLNAEDKLMFDDYVTLAEYSNVLLNIGRFWNLSESEFEKQELADMYLLMTEHLLDQGFVDGSGLVTTHHWGYASRWWYISAMLMSDVLAENQLRQPVFDALLWYSREFKANFEMVTGPESSDLDYFNTLSRQHLSLLMLEPDMDRRIALLKKFGNYINVALSQTPPGGRDGLRPDGTAWRHEGNYPGYSFPAFNNAAQLVYMLDGTPFSVSSEGRVALKKAMLAAWVYSNPEVGLGLSGRHPFNPPALRHISEGYRWLALSGNPETGDKVDTQLAAAYLQMTGKDLQASFELFEQEITPATLPQGYWAFNGGAFGIHRYKDDMVTMKAYNSNVWSSEIYYRDNRYGRYQSHGAVQIIPYGKQSEIGFVQEGWDWNRNPGTTTIHLPLEKLESPQKHTLMLRADQPFSGASSLDGKYGMFAFKFQAASLPNMDSSFTARKSTLSVEDRIVMSGSNISNGTSEYSTETTLFQYALTDKSSSVWINGEEVTDMPYQAQLTEGDWLIDGHGNGYLLTKGATVEVRRQHQESANDRSREKTEGDFVVAWIDHGTEPDNAEYEYLILLDASPQKMAQLAAEYQQGEKPYRVVRKDKSAHVVYDKQSKTTGYAAFDGTSFDDSLVMSMDKASIVMTQELPDNTLKISGVTPDLNMTRYTAAKPTSVQATIKGQWQVVEANEKVTVSPGADSTKISFIIYFGIPQEVTLKKVD